TPQEGLRAPAADRPGLTLANQNQNVGKGGPDHGVEQLGPGRQQVWIHGGPTYEELGAIRSRSLDLSICAFGALFALCQRGAIVRLDPSFVHPCPVPKLLGNIERVDVGGLPPGLFIADAMHLAMVHPAERHRELVACLAPERPWLCVAQVVWVGW